MRIYFKDGQYKGSTERGHKNQLTNCSKLQTCWDAPGGIKADEVLIKAW